MAGVRIKRALISVHDKTNVERLGRGLTRLGVEILSTGGTARLLTDAGVDVTLVEQATGAPEMLDGRVKTLHPVIHAAILADRQNPAHVQQLADHGIEPIDLVVCNLYPFESVVAQPDCSFEDAIENIDIGGPAMVRAAAKNHRSVLIVCTSHDYPLLLDHLERNDCVIDADDPIRLTLAHHAFNLVWLYNRAISRYLFGELLRKRGAIEPPEVESADDVLPPELDIFLARKQKLRYGENPHQAGGLYLSGAPVAGTIANARQIGGMGMSFINYLDAHAALELVRDLGQLGCPSAAVIVKHASPCGAAVGDDPVEAYRRAYLSDPVAAMGGILAINTPVDVRLAEAVVDSYANWGKAAGAGGFLLHVWVAPAFDDQAVKLITERKAWGKDVRLLAVGPIAADFEQTHLDVKPLGQAVLVQTVDAQPISGESWQVVTRREPTDAEMVDLRFAWLVCKHVKSNAIVIAKGQALAGAGAGQTSRVMSCRIAAELAGERVKGAVAASDAYFPFPDGPAALAKAGVTAIVQPGGSKGDQATIDFCNEHDVAMVFTGTRHFLH
ncbi:MAG TPA: bifunctional phosphoribosylaminoimidazolecarboxamide formyltransferase/IMP cyclohydrolase [Phycisphaerae bacterium]|nr:bifunctional phosphoribosylaminoimidazolecarboxamide formyltransferase/IMP cyclohydrolase [Phycisphaerae bacterium]